MIKPIEKHADPNKVRFVEALLEDFIMMGQIVTGMSSFTFIAVLGKLMGEIAACNDCGVEKEFNIGPDDDRREPLKGTFMLNFEAGYNTHRAKHEREECVKPEPKIV